MNCSPGAGTEFTVPLSRKQFSYQGTRGITGKGRNSR